MSSCDKQIESPIVGRTWTIILKSSLCLSLCLSLKLTIKVHSRKQSFPFVSSYCFFWSTVKTGNHDKRQIKEVKQETRSRKGQAHSCGSVLQFLITVIGDWLPLLHSLITAKETNIKAQHALDPTRFFPADCLALTQLNQCYILTSISATLPSSSDIFAWWWDGV